MKEQLQQYLHNAFGNRPPYATNDINQDCSIGGQVHIRFELGSQIPNGTRERVTQATQRATMLFEETFAALENEIWVLIYGYQEDLICGTPEVLKKQFPTDKFSRFYNQVQAVGEGTINTDEPGNEGSDERDVRIIIGKIRVQDIKYRNILEAIANSEMGFEPAIDERIYFIDPSSDRIFYMYDDRGCFIASNSADNIREIYHRRNDWIVDYHRSEIDKYFK